ncbi:hypothetical protein [Virgibacillus doumboii]|uniref:hypothetical protein n=1 Tax=Virgibacillus doumboii TaxID=2697503 RepID=UPI0013DF44BC|nr:hypothetical protein [Virgibacillus doumboii]
MHHSVALYLACILAGFALANIPTSSVITAGIATFFQIIGGLAVIVFSLAILYLGVKSLLDK